MLRFLVHALAVWRISYMLVNEDGPNRVFRKLRQASGMEYGGPDSSKAYAWNDWTPLHCILCTSVYIGGVSLALPQWILNMFALSAVTVLIERVCDDG
jgi:hypothetical protein